MQPYAELPGERWFALLTDNRLRRGVHKKLQALEKDIRDWVASWNENPRPCVRTKTAERLSSYLNEFLAQDTWGGASCRPRRDLGVMHDHWRFSRQEQPSTPCTPSGHCGGRHPRADQERE